MSNTIIYNTINNNDNDKSSSSFLKKYLSKKKNSSSGSSSNSDNNPSTEYIKKTMYLWVKEFVWGLKLCPFSGSVLNDNKMNIHINNDNDDKQGLQRIFDYIINESNYIINNDTNDDAKYTTTLLVLSSSKWIDFHNYLALVEDVEELLVSTKLNNDIQIATFHPNYIFDGNDEDDVENYTNRSPFPCIHLLKVEEVSEAIESFGDTKLIYENNIKKMNSIGLKAIVEMNEKIKKDAQK